MFLFPLRKAIEFLEGEGGGDRGSRQTRFVHVGCILFLSCFTSWLGWLATHFHNFASFGGQEIIVFHFSKRDSVMRFLTSFVA